MTLSESTITDEEIVKIRLLRSLSGYGMMDCYKVLKDNFWNLDNAFNWLQQHGSELYILRCEKENK